MPRLGAAGRPDQDQRRMADRERRVHKGFRLPGAQVAVSSKHTLALTNRGGGTTAQLLDLAREIRSRVEGRFGITLEPEPVLLGLLAVGGCPHVVAR